jgi:hypothetical protein
MEDAFRARPSPGAFCTRITLITLRFLDRDAPSRRSGGVTTSSLLAHNASTALELLVLVLVYNKYSSWSLDPILTSVPGSIVP